MDEGKSSMQSCAIALNEEEEGQVGLSEAAGSLRTVTVYTQMLYWLYWLLPLVCLHCNPPPLLFSQTELSDQ